MHAFTWARDPKYDDVSVRRVFLFLSRNERTTNGTTSHNHQSNGTAITDDAGGDATRNVQVYTKHHAGESTTTRGGGATMHFNETADALCFGAFGE